MSDQEKTEAFLTHLQEEKLKTQAARNAYVMRKLIYATGLLGLGAIKAPSVDLRGALYLVPFLALAFDLYIMGEDYSIKRIGAFLGAVSQDPRERDWEDWISRNRDPFAPFAMPLLTTVLSAAAAAVLWPEILASLRIRLTWLPLAFLPSWALFIYYRRLRQRALKRAAFAGTSDALKGLRSRLSGQDHLLTRQSYYAIKEFFIAMRGADLSELSPEYGTQEYLRNVTNTGSRIQIEDEIMSDFRRMRTESSEFSEWFKDFATPEGESELLPARWLCHLAGLRHVSAHLFLTPLDDSDHMLVQVRSLAKAESPAAFDLPVAGHVEFDRSERDAIIREAYEELGLDERALADLKDIGGYTYEDRLIGGSGLYNVEFRKVFRAALSADAVARLRPARNEVAAIAVFSVTEVAALVAKFPERVASGLRSSLPVFTATTKKRDRGASA